MISEKYFSLKRKILIFFLLSCTVRLFGQAPTHEHIRFALWAQMDAYPEFAASDMERGPYDFSVQMIQNTAPFIISGMVYGWEYTYTPSDKTRGVEEFFEVRDLKPDAINKMPVHYDSPWLENERLNVWVSYTRTPQELLNYKLWSSIKNPKIRGTGKGDIRKGFNGIDEACRDALKDAVRQFYRQEIKNKPKEISGSVLIINPPTIGVHAGKYTISLDFFMERGKIKEYKTF